MNPTREQQKRLAADLAEIAALPEERQLEALLKYLMQIWHETPLDDLRRRRNQFLERFADCGGSYETCSAVLAMVDQHLAHRAKAGSAKAGGIACNSGLTGSNPRAPRSRSGRSG